MLTEVLAFLRNWFEHAKFFGQFTIENGSLQETYDSGAAFGGIHPKNGQYFRIIGSALNDGVYQWPTNKLKDEVFDGAVWLLAVPPVVVSIANEIQTWQTANGGADSAAMSPFQSESFGGYSYSKGAAGSSSNQAAAVSWQDAYKTRLAPWRKI